MWPANVSTTLSFPIPESPLREADSIAAVGVAKSARCGRLGKEENTVTWDACSQVGWEVWREREWRRCWKWKHWTSRAARMG